MLRKLLAVVFLAAIAVAVWYAARLLAGRDELRFTIVFESPVVVDEGAPVVLEGERIGRVREVTDLDGRSALSLSIEGERRADVRTDSLFYVDGAPPDARLLVNNAIALGPPVSEGAVITIGDERIKRWLADRSAKLSPTMKRLAEKAKVAWNEWESPELGKAIEEWERKLPEWDDRDAAMRRQLEALKQKAKEVEAQLRAENKKERADALRRRFDQWLAERLADEKKQQ